MTVRIGDSVIYNQYCPPLSDHLYSAYLHISEHDEKVTDPDHRF